MKTMLWMRPVLLAGLGLVTLGAAALLYAPHNKPMVKAALVVLGVVLAAVDRVRGRRG